MAMVMGIFPVVGIPLPLVSYGGTVLLTVLGSMGLVMSCYIHRDVRISRRDTSEACGARPLPARARPPERRHARRFSRTLGQLGQPAWMGRVWIQCVN